MPRLRAICSHQRRNTARSLLLIAWTGFGCGDEPEPAASAEAESVIQTPRGVPPKPAPDPHRLEAELGAGMVAMLTSAEQAWFAELRVISAAQAERPAVLADQARIRGYPPQRPLRPLSSEVARKIASILIDRRSYQIGERRRCRIERLVGLRFKAADEVCDVVVSAPCGGVFWSSDWAEPLRDDVAEKLLALVPSNR